MSAGHQSKEDVVYRLDLGLDRYLETNEAFAKTGYDMRVHQEPTHSTSHCSDSRQKAELATGESALGKALELANPGGFLTGADGKLTSEAGRWLELTTAYGIPKAAVIQHSGCGQMNVLYTYHMVDGGKETIRDSKGAFFASDAESRHALIETVRKNGLGYYESMGIPLVGSDADKFQQAMAIQQLQTDMKAIEVVRTTNAKLPKIEGQFHHIVVGRFFKVAGLEPMKFEEVKTAKPSRGLESSCQSKGCCCPGH